MNLKSYNPFVTFLSLLILTFAFSFTFNLVITLCLLCLIWIALLFTGVFIGAFLKVNGIALFLGTTLFIGTFIWGKSPYQFLLSFTVASRPLVFMAAGLLFHTSHSSYDFIESLQQNAKLPSHFTYGLFAVFNLVSLIQLQYQRNRLAFRLRGYRVMALSPKLMLSLLFKTIYWVDHLEIAMVSKGFHPQHSRTHTIEYHITTKDHIFLAISILLSLVMMLYP
ncbi:energy-coupling factor transporter transmembrane protein EcfT [Streptococcus dysgalactiae]|uniref:Energy-coupling factor transporter transmembrane protein EcfT n=1 Tax=Streptococcus dysgalactiae TaxID=1334 RepID=A0AAE9UKK1_STRDY|nr:energy-coupling factor transporter transmembrane component T [Streptococcus dysgalactiae]WAI92323.1 energy-coupling factor transporter transmembrane protein EcfT [Streptococcus dysgalactiae]